jgi:outer membrane protein assembly factor BamB
MQFHSHLLEEKFVTRAAMKAAPQKSALESNASVANTGEMANEILNEMQRNYGGDTVTEDESRYLIKMQYPGGSNLWSGEITGPPKLFPLKTVTVLASNKKVTVFDKSNKKLWEGTLNYSVPGGGGEADEESVTTGEGPCVEHKDTLYVFDQGVLHAFDIKTGNARWRFPCVGISGIFFDEKDNLYVNGSDASPDTIKYSKQIDVSSKVNSLIQKVDGQTGKLIWASQPGGTVSYVSGPYIYVVQSYGPDEGDEEDENPYSVTTGFETQPYLRIRRINPKNGKEMWEHFQQRAPLDVEFDKNTIRLVFRKEVQVLKTSTF